MPFAYPPRKSSNPPPFRARSSRITLHRRRQLKTIAFAGVGIVFLLWLLFGRGGSHGSGKQNGSGGGSGSSSSSAHRSRTISGQPPVVLVTVFDNDLNAEYLETLRQNRIEYAEAHGMLYLGSKRP